MKEADASAVQVARWGDSLAVRLPKALVDRLHLRAGDELRIVAVDADRIAVEKAGERRAALRRMSERGWALPIVPLDRDEANER